MSAEKQVFSYRLDVERLNSEKEFQHAETSIFTGDELQNQALHLVKIPSFISSELQRVPKDQVRIKASISVIDMESGCDFVVQPEEVSFNQAWQIHRQFQLCCSGTQDRTNTILKVADILGPPQNPANKKFTTQPAPSQS